MKLRPHPLDTQRTSMKTSEDARSEAPSSGLTSEFRGLVVLAEAK